jgi:hypothetical protein
MRFVFPALPATACFSPVTTFPGKKTPFVRGRLLLLLFLIWSALTLVAFSQENRAGILGVVSDKAAASVPGAQVKVTNVDTGIVTSGQTDQTGNYNIPFLPPGNYRAEARAAGFAVASNPSFVLHAQQTLRLDFSLQVGNISQTISVTSQAPMLQTASTSSGVTIASESINALPIVQRNLVAVALLGPGMQTSQNGTSVAIAKVLTVGVTVTSNGIRDTANYWTIDGANVNSGFYNYPSFVPVPDAVQEFTVMTGPYSAEYGQFAGAHVNYTLKSGTNSLHGSVFEYLENTDLNARQYFAPTRPALQQNQFGALLTGPVKRNNTFFMLSYEGFRANSNVFTQNVVLTQAERTGNLTAGPGGAAIAPFKDPLTGLPFPNNQIPTSRISPTAQAALQILEPLPNESGASNYAAFFATPQQWDNGLVKVDHSFGSRDQLSGRYLIQDLEWQSTVAAYPFGVVSTPQRFKNIALIETHAFSPNAVLEARGSWNWKNSYQTYPEVTPSLDTRSLFDMIIPSNIAPGSTMNLYPSFAVAGYSQIGPTGNGPTYQKDRNYEIGADLVFNKQRHAFKFGFEVDRNRSFRFVNNNTNGDLTFAATNPAGTGNAVADFLLGRPSSSVIALVPDLVDLRRTAIDIYGDDKWSITPKLTIDMGLRFEHNIPVSEYNGLVSLFNFTPPGSFTILKPGGELYDGDAANLAPRLGLAYRFSDRDVLRVASGIYYSNNPQLNLTFLASNPPAVPSYAFTSAANAPLSSSNAFPVSTAASGGVPAPYYIPPTIHTAAAYEWMADVQHSLNPSMLFSIGYLGNRGVHFGRTMQLNVPLAGGPGAIQARRPLPSFGSTTAYLYDDFSTYESLQARIEKRFSHGLTFLASYTWSKALDMSSNELSGGTVIPTNLNFEYGPADFHTPQNFTVSYVYQLPVGRGRLLLNSGGILDEIIGGWQLSGVTTLHSGNPNTITYPGDVANVGLGTRPNRVCRGTLPNPSIHEWFNTSCFVAPAQYTFGNAKRGIILGPAYKDYDFSLSKTFSIPYKEQSLQFRGEFFNGFNNVNFGQPNDQVNTPTAGQITSTNAARIGQVGLTYRF